MSSVPSGGHTFSMLVGEEELGPRQWSFSPTQVGKVRANVPKQIPDLTTILIRFNQRIKITDLS